MKNRLILASSSAYRKQLLEKVCPTFDCFNPDIDESPKPKETPELLVLRLAEQKALAGKTQFPKNLIIGSDQVCCINGEIVGKPGNHQNAVKQLKAASGQAITFYTGLALYNSETQQMQSLIDTFEVGFRELSDSLIERYLQIEQPYNCAGSFKSEGSGIVLFKHLKGDDPNSLIGLPLIKLCGLLESQDFELLS
ncbi:septum formation inhibitor Maf [Agarivorans sp. B2Z047]|uniref:Maf family protein n=1 Tax=Agarivorans sp. B2Z047 TaxID=2652721 RepID=UPI00128E9240|nr:nucleoside triphosphate pyrophosphatase [Agarivorans sp. B2Z047]MPW30885.1 septum formation inhibitor Maf [Agarivorans sp. B2Z047]UQN40886.1 Maf-like protein [Agarivorans sp. B2Z047]